MSILGISLSLFYGLKTQLRMQKKKREALKSLMKNMNSIFSKSPYLLFALLSCANFGRVMTDVLDMNKVVVTIAGKPQFIDMSFTTESPNAFGSQLSREDIAKSEKNWQEWENRLKSSSRRVKVPYVDTIPIGVEQRLYFFIQPISIVDTIKVYLVSQEYKKKHIITSGLIPSIISFKRGN